MGFMMKVAARAALSGGRNTAAKAAKAAALASKKAAHAAAAHAAAIAMNALREFCGNPDNAGEQQCVALQARDAAYAAQQQKLVEYKEFCNANFWSFSCMNIWGWLFLLVIIVLICCCICDCADEEDNYRRRRRHY